MAAGTYIGRSPVYGAFQRQVFTGTTNGSTTVFTLNIAVPAAEALMVVISGVVQEPSIAYVASGTTLSLTGAPATGEQFYVVYLGNQLVQAGAVAAIVDADADTQIQVEESADEDTIRFDAAGAEAARISATGLDIAGSNKELRFYEAANYVGFEAPALSANQIWVLPAADGTNGQMLSTNGSGTLAWATASSTVTGLTDTTISSIASGELLKWNGSAWINNTLAEAGIAPVASPDFTTAVNLLARGELRFQDAAGGQYVGFEAPATVSSNVMWVLPAADGSNGQMLSTNGSGTLAWATVSSTSLTDADNNTKVQVEESADENKIRFDTAGTERMIIAADGKVGIGTTSPSQPLHIKHPSGGTYLRLEDGSSSYKYDLGVENGQGNAFVLNDANANAIRMVVKTDGKVGIGTTNPTRQLELKGANENGPLVIDTASGTHAGIWLKENATDRWQVYSEASSGDLTFFNYGTSEVDMRVKANGLVGIGTSSPTNNAATGGVTLGTSKLLHIHGSDGAAVKCSDPSTGSNRGFSIGFRNIPSDLQSNIRPASGRPAGRHDPIIFDTALSEMTLVAIHGYEARGEPLPEGVALDGQGAPTTDPAAALAGILLPMGQHRGSGLAVIWEVLTGVLAGGDRFMTDVTMPDVFDKPQGTSMFHLAINPEIVMPYDQFVARVDDMIDRLHASPTIEGVEQVRVPGEMAARRAREAQKSGVALAQEMYDQLAEFAEPLGVRWE